MLHRQVRRTLDDSVQELNTLVQQRESTAQKPESVTSTGNTVINTDTYNPIMEIPSDAKIVLDQSSSPPGAIELFAMKYPDHVVIEKNRDAIDAAYITCHKEEIDKWSREVANYGIKVLNVEIGDRDIRSNPGAEGEGQMGVQQSPETTINNALIDQDTTNRGVLIKKEKIGTGVGNEYRKKAKSGGDVLFKVKIKGREFLTEDIPLHMSLKVFDAKQKMDIEDIKAKVKKLGITKPDPRQLTFKTKIHHSDESDTDYFMLMIDGCPSSYKKFYDTIDGVQYKEYFTHVTIDKPLYDQIRKEGLKPSEVHFDNLSVEKGAGNTIYEFPEDNLEKSLKTAATGAMIAASSLMGQPAATPHVDKPAQTVQAPAFKAPTYNSDHMLRTIASVESSGGKDTQHKRLHSGEQAYGKYALTPNIIRETISLHPELRHKYQKATILRGPQLQNYMKDNPSLEDAIAKQHLRRLEKHFGQDINKLSYGWLNGIRGTYKAINNKEDIANHWHVLKARKAYAATK